MDNGTQFQAQVHEKLAAQWGFYHVTSSPYHSQSKGKAEATAKIAERMLKKVKQDHLLILLILLL